MDWKTMLAYISGSVDEELLLRNEYLVAENRILRNQSVDTSTRRSNVPLSNSQRSLPSSVDRK